MVLIGVAVSLAWAVTATVAAYLIFMRREFTNSGHDGAGRRAITLGGPAARRPVRRLGGGPGAGGAGGDRLGDR